MKKYYLFLIVIVFVKHASSQVERFEPALFPDGRYFGLTISPDGKEMFFVKTFGGRDSLQIHQATKMNGQWSKPQPAVFADLKAKQIDPLFSPDGQSLLFNSMPADKNHFDVYITYKEGNSWSKPVALSAAVNSPESDFYASVAKNKNIYFTRRTTSNDIYVSYFKDGQYQKAVPLEGFINTSGNESNPFISPDESFIIFFADRKNGFGETDLYISFNKENKWSKPISLGKEINSAEGEFCPAIDFSNKRFLFSRTIVINGKRSDNMYTYPLKKLGIRNLRKQAEWAKE